MKKFIKPRTLPAVVLGMGAVALLLRRLLFFAAVDERGLLVRNHPLEWALAALSAAALLLIVVSVWKLDGSSDYGDNFQESFPAAVGHILASSGILITVLTNAPAMPGYLGNLWRILGWLAPLCLLAAGYARLVGKQPFFLLHLIPCLFFVFHIICHYRSWSGEPQLQEYVFSLFGTIALMLCLFQTAAFEVGTGKRRMQMGMGLTAVYLCMAELALSWYPYLYIGGVVWALTNLCSPYPRPRKTEEA